MAVYVSNLALGKLSGGVPGLDQSGLCSKFQASQETPSAQSPEFPEGQQKGRAFGTLVLFLP